MLIKKTRCWMVLAVPFLAVAVGQQLPPGLVSLVEAEKSFAQTSVEKGIREAFLAFFAEEGVNFQPHPVNTRETMLKRPPTPKPAPVTLNWAPYYGDISQSGDFGYTTGPYVLTGHGPEKRPPQYGLFSSVWKKQADGSWKVVLDLGIQTERPAAPLDAPFHVAPPVKPRQGVAPADLEKEREGLLQLEREFLAAAKSLGTAAAYSRFMTDAARLHRDGRMPFLGKQSILAFLREKPAELQGEPIRADVSRLADLGYAYGSYELKGNEPLATLAEKGYYVHIWKRDAQDRWKIVLDVTNPLK